MTRTGKIARLPHDIRHQLNFRIRDGEKGRALVAWLNSLEQTRVAMARDFAGQPITEQNFSEWKHGGYAEWLTRQERLDEMREVVSNTREIAAATQGALADHLAASVSIRYAAALIDWDGQPSDDFKNKIQSLNQIIQDIATLRKGDHSADRIKIEREWLNRDRELTEREILDYFHHWASNSEVRECLLMDQEDSQHRLRKILGLTSIPTDYVVPDDEGPNCDEEAAENEDDDEEPKDEQQIPSGKIKPAQTNSD